MEKGYDVEVVGRDLSEMYCPICLLLMRNPAQFECTHALCKPCFERLKTFGDRDQEPNVLCPTCRETINIDKVWEDGMMKRMILVVNVKCSNHNRGCSWIGELGNMDDHLNSCDETLTPCIFNGCSDEHLRKDMRQHQEICVYRIVVCVYCNVEYVFNEEDNHYMECEGYPITCKFGCGNKISRSQIEGHYENCELRIVACSYQFCGCDIEVVWKELQKHLQENAQFHLSLTMKTIALQNNKYDEMSTTLMEKNNKLESTSDLCVKAISKFTDISTNMCHLTLNISTYDHWLKTEIDGFDDQALSNLSLRNFTSLEECVRKKYDNSISDIADLRAKVTDTKLFLGKTSNAELISSVEKIPAQVDAMKISLDVIHSNYKSLLQYKARFRAFSHKLETLEWNAYRTSVLKIKISELFYNVRFIFYKEPNGQVRITRDKMENRIDQKPQLHVTSNSLTVDFIFRSSNCKITKAIVELINQNEPTTLSSIRRPSYFNDERNRTSDVCFWFPSLDEIKVDFKQDGYLYIRIEICYRWY